MTDHDKSSADEREAPQAYRVEPGRPGCACCNRGATWDVVGPDGVAQSVSFHSLDDAEHLADSLSEAYELGSRDADRRCIVPPLLLAAAGDEPIEPDQVDDERPF